MPAAPTPAAPLAATQRRRGLVVLARWPAPGRCKRRLARSCGSAVGAARLQAGLTRHTLAAATAAAQRLGHEPGGLELTLAADGLGPRALRRWGAALGIARCIPQGGGGLGTRLQRQLRQRFAEGCEQVVLIGSDLPGLECADLLAAFSALAEAPLVLGPAGDGGYWLIGLSRQGFLRAGAQLMAGIPWGSATVLAETLQRARALELPAALLRQQQDLDQRSDLTAWIRPRRAGRGSR